MRRTIAAVALLIALGWTVAAISIEANGGGPITNRLFAASGTGTLEYVFLPGEYPPSGFTLYSVDGSAFAFKRRFADGVNDTIGITVPAGRSILIPPPGAIMDAANDTLRMTIWVDGATDTVIALPWYR